MQIRRRQGASRWDGPGRRRAAGKPQSYGIRKQIEAVRDCRSVGKKGMKLNAATPKIEVNPENYKVTADGEHLTCEPAKVLPLARRYSLF